MRMGLPCKDQLDRRLGVVHKRLERIDVVYEQVRALIRREAPSETDRQPVETEGPPQLRDSVGRCTEPLGLMDDPPPHQVDELLFQGLVCFPELAVVDGINAIPDARPDARSSQFGPKCRS